MTEYSLQISDPTDFIYDTTVEVQCPSAEASDNGVLGGRVWLEHLDIGRAIDNRQDLFEICDAKSQDWYHIHRAIFEPNTYDLRAEFEFVEPLISLVYVKHFVLCPQLHKWRSFVLDSLSHPYSHESAFVMWNALTELSNLELHALGFRRIARTDLLLRPNMDKHDYGADGENRDVYKVSLPPAVADSVEAAWRKAIH